MSIALWCVLIAGMLPYAATVIAKGGSGFDNRNPRDWLARQEGFRRRANAAQANGFETFPLFAVAVVVATLHHGPGQRVDLLAITFVAARIAYLLCYLADQATLRSVCWMVGIAATIAIFVA
jgi:uncharacterized MAPEG superfamily protein